MTVLKRASVLGPASSHINQQRCKGEREGREDGGGGVAEVERHQGGAVGEAEVAERAAGRDAAHTSASQHTGCGSIKVFRKIKAIFLKI